MYCQKCGTQNADNMVSCTNCGAQLQESVPVQTQDFNSQQNFQNQPPVYQTNQFAGAKPKSMVVAIILSVLITGGGQIYLGQLKKGLAILIGGVLVSLLIGKLGILIWIASLIDTQKIATKVINGKKVEEFEFF